MCNINRPDVYSAFSVRGSVLKHFTCIVHLLTQLPEVGLVMMPILQRGKLRQKEAKHLAQGHSDSEPGLKLRVLSGVVCVATKFSCSVPAVHTRADKPAPWALGLWPPTHLLADQAENAIIDTHPYLP